MKALSKTAVALAMGAIATQSAQPLSPFMGLNARDRQTAEDYNQACADLQTRMANLDKLITRYNDALQRLEGVPEDLQEELETRAKENKKLASEIEDLQQKLVDGVQQRGANPDSVAGILIRNKNIVDQAQAITRAKGKFQFDDLHARNIVTLAGLGDTAQFAQSSIPTPERALTLLDLIAFTPVQNELVPLFRESAFDIMADEVDEAEEKPESNLEFGVVDLKTGTIAHWIKVSIQLISDMPALAAYIEGRMAYGVRLKLEAKIVRGDGRVSGARSFIGLIEDGTHLTVAVKDADTAIDVLNRSKYKAGAAGILPEYILLNPESWGAIERIKGTDGHYVFGAPGAAVQPVLWNLPVILTAAMPVGGYWTGNITLGVSAYIREEVAVELSTEDGDNFRKNLCTVRAEMRAASGVSIPDACVAGSLPAIEEIDAPVIVVNTVAELSGTAEPNSVIIVRVGSVAKASTVADTAGTWSIEPNPLGADEQAKVIAVLGAAVSEAVDVVGPA
ncbi:phage major capsid protein [Acinetobacter sp. WCHAc060007]|uniref:phage major capsid protein n=1 Tax=Acinetobacter sp. WCHAc060007 TaxID=2419605 RepID=UPI000EA1B38E|nr:phage major capsid protein [Acinetobacter sp. WCHAc060007]RKG38656.1 phage major capsid protein [Acinetobacter sp. WCHAc060007]